ncbi:hypothetical protein Rin_00016450, partial [Candidatus Regiella insecticola 5.15]
TLNKNAQRCLLLLVQDNVHHPKKIQADHWIPIWVGQRPADRNNFTFINSLSDGSSPYWARLPTSKAKEIWPKQFNLI